jgi:hypothetical protein
MTPVESVASVAAGFVPTLIALELAWRMGKHIGRRGENHAKIRTGLR